MLVEEILSCHMITEKCQGCHMLAKKNSDKFQDCHNCTQAENFMKVAYFISLQTFVHRIVATRDQPVDRLFIVAFRPEQHRRNKRYEKGHSSFLLLEKHLCCNSAFLRRIKKYNISCLILLVWWILNFVLLQIFVVPWVTTGDLKFVLLFLTKLLQ